MLINIDLMGTRKSHGPWSLKKILCPFSGPTLLGPTRSHFTKSNVKRVDPMFSKSLRAVIRKNFPRLLYCLYFYTLLNPTSDPQLR